MKRHKGKSFTIKIWNKPKQKQYDYGIQYVCDVCKAEFSSTEKAYNHEMYYDHLVQPIDKEVKK